MNTRMSPMKDSVTCGFSGINTLSFRPARRGARPREAGDSRHSQVPFTPKAQGRGPVPDPQPLPCHLDQGQAKSAWQVATSSHSQLWLPMACLAVRRGRGHLTKQTADYLLYHPPQPGTSQALSHLWFTSSSPQLFTYGETEARKVKPPF